MFGWRRCRRRLFPGASVSACRQDVRTFRSRTGSRGTATMREPGMIGSNAPRTDWTAAFRAGFAADAKALPAKLTSTGI